MAIDRSISFSPTSKEMERHRQNTNIEPLKAIILILIIALTSYVITLFHIEENLNLPKLMPLIAGGFAINIFLPPRLRLPFLFCTTIGSILYLFGFIQGSILTGIALFLFAIAHLPIKFSYRLALLAAFTLLFTGLRAEWIPYTGSIGFLSILGSMFMFRMLLYMHELRYEKVPSGIWLKLNYFFLLPNLVFPIFPVVDYTTFINNYYSKPALDTYRRGFIMMANGLFHLFLYRIIYYYLLPAPGEVDGLMSLSQYIVSSYALIVRLAGIFHFSVGVISLFGFYLPPVFEHYFLAHNFSDIWRRINIYWRDFMTRVFYYPIYFKLKKFGAIFSMVLSILLVFVINWFLHGWQWFWIRGSFPLTAQDILFWSIFGIAVAINTYIQISSSKNKSQNVEFSWSFAIKRMAQILSMFSAMAVLWSFWTSGSISEWYTMMTKGRTATLTDIVILVSIAGILLFLGTIVQWYNYKRQINKSQVSPPNKLNFIIASSFILIMGLAGIPQVKSYFSHTLQADLEPVFKSKLNNYDREQLYKGYYETLLVGSNLNSQIWELEKQKEDDQQDNNLLEAGIRRNDIMIKELKPNQSMAFKGGLLTTNNHGLRDKEYSLTKPDSTIRIALIGGSIEMGVGVNTDETYENLVEDALNKKIILKDGFTIEILNFAISGNHLFQNIAMFEKKAAQFQPDIVLYAAHSNEVHRIVNSIYKAYSTRRDLSYDILRDLVAEHQFTHSISEAEFMNVLAPKKMDIAMEGYKLLYKFSLENNCLPIWMYVPTLDDNEIPGEADTLQIQLNKIGFTTFSIANAFQGYETSALKLADYDSHPNKKGHQLLAEEVIEQIMNHPALAKAITTARKD